MTTMKFQYCRDCSKETWQNPLKRAKATDEQRYRCVECGRPLRLGGMAKNYGAKIGGRVKFFGPGQPVI